MAKNEIRITGLGGQGVILSAYILGKAASIFDDKSATMNQSFGPEARGSACSTQLIVSSDEIRYPYISGSDVLVAMSQEGFNKHLPELREKGMVVLEEDLVKVEGSLNGQKVFKCPATRIAEEKLGKKIVLNIVMLGYLTKVTGVVNEKAMREAIKTSVPGGTEELNLKAFDLGFSHGQTS